MRQMKDSGIEWIGIVPSDWQIIRMKNCILRHDGGAWGDEKQGNDRDIVCMRVADFDYQRLKFTDSEDFTIRNYTKEQIDKLILRNGDILIEKSGGGEKTPVGRAVIFDRETPALFANFLERIRTNENMVSEFLLYILTAFYSNGYIKNYIKQTTGIQNLDIQTMISSVFVAVPKIHLQQRISCFLHTKCAKIDGLIFKQQEAIEKIKKYKLSVITEAATKGLNPNVPMKDSSVEFMGEVPRHWRMIRLKFLMSHIIDCPHETPNYSPDGDYLVIRTADEDFGFLRPDEDMYRLDEAEYQNRIRRLPLDKDDIVYGREGERWGLACLVPESNRYCLGQRTMQFRCNKDIILPEFAMWALNSRYVYLQGSVDTIGSTSPHVNISTMRNYNIPVPPLDEQREIVGNIRKKTNQIDWEIRRREKLIVKLTEYKKALIYEVVTGKREV